MSEAKHTPGPWVASWRDYGGVIGKDGYVVAQAATFRNKEVIEANARLIAAAPELLEALQELHDIVQGLIDDDVAPQGFVDSFTLQPARHALNKATRKTVGAP